VSVIPDISVVMSVYNGARFLRETMDSVLAQKGVSFEFIIVNDGSTDQSASILEGYASRDDRVRLFRQENQGLTKSLIRACSEARGKYIARHDAGDISDPDRLHLQKSALDRTSDLAFVSCWSEFCGPRWEFLYLVKGTGRAASPAYVISETENHGVIDGPTHHGSVMFRTGIYVEVGGYRADFYYGQDWDLWYRLADRGRFQMVEQSLYKARLVPASISAYSKSKQASLAELSRAALLQRIKGLPEQDILQEAGRIRPPHVGKRSARHESEWLYFIGECLRRNNDRRSLGYFTKSIRIYPFRLESWLRLLQLSFHLNNRLQ
jgi:glycosyltransferase involved in cell wall biosynthesis